MKITVQRKESFAGATIGQLKVNDQFVCYTLEDEVREISGVPVSEWKINGVTAIPAGNYRVSLEFSQRFGPDTLTINDVPGFKFIRMHAGNYAGYETFYKSVLRDSSKDELNLIEYLDVIND